MFRVQHKVSVTVGNSKVNASFSPSVTDCDGSHGPDRHHSELLPDWSVWSAAAPLPVAQPWDGHHLHRHPRGTTAPSSAAPSEVLRPVLSQNFFSGHQHFVTERKVYGNQKTCQAFRLQTSLRRCVFLYLQRLWKAVWQNISLHQMLQMFT